MAQYDVGECNENLLQAFKKLKSSLFFDKTQPIQRERVMQFECIPTFHQRILEIANALVSDSDESWVKIEDSILSSVTKLVYPKRVLSGAENSTGDEEERGRFIANIWPSVPKVERFQFCIDMDAEGFLLGMLWVMLVGVDLDGTFAECAYGNRIRKDAKKRGVRNYSPYIFEPYFSQYGKWRDGALDEAERAHEKNGVDVVILSIDFKSFYYSIDLRDDDWNEIGLAVGIPEKDSQTDSQGTAPQGNTLNEVQRRLTGFVKKVMQAYSRNLWGDASGEDARCILPIGFSPSPILANWCMSKFDAAVNGGVNPLFYGRYVDDIMLVDKVEDNSPLKELWEEGALDADGVFDHYFSSGNEPLFIKCDDSASNTNALKEGMTKRVNPVYLNARNSAVTVQSEKVRVFYFDKAAPHALIKEFRRAIAKNSSEFRDMPGIEGLALEDSYSVVFDLRGGDSPNKFREVEEIRLNCYELSKFLGRSGRLGSDLNGDDTKLREFTDGLIGLYEPFDLIERYSTWEKLFEIGIRFGNFEMLKNAVERITSVIDKVDVADDCKDEVSRRYFGTVGHDVAVDELRVTLIRSLGLYFTRALSLVWNPEIDAILTELERRFENDLKGSTSVYPSFSTATYPAIKARVFWKESIGRLRRQCLSTYMVDKYAMPVLPQFVIPRLQFNSDLAEEAKTNLTCFDDVLKLLTEDAGDASGNDQDSQLGLFPYVVKKNDLEFSLYTSYMARSDGFPLPDEIHARTLELYRELNKFSDAGNANKDRPDVFEFCGASSVLKSRVVHVPQDGISGKPTKLRVGVCNVFMEDEMIEKSLQCKPGRSFERYSDLVKIVNASRKEHVDVLVLPECCVPYSWLPRLVTFSANNQMAIVCGVEPFVAEAFDADGKAKRIARNLTAVILPYKQDDYLFAKLVLHEKVHLSPKEVALCKSYGWSAHSGSGYELYHWQGVWFPVYCCFELASINDRAIFSAYADVLFAVEWNADTNYFSKVLGSLARDLSCCCVQVNNSKYGDSRITLPDKTEKMDLLKVKGGSNSVLLVGDVDVESLRLSQLKSDGGPYKPPPPGFNHEVVRKKAAGELLDYLKRQVSPSFTGD